MCNLINSCKIQFPVLTSYLLLDHWQDCCPRHLWLTGTGSSSRWDLKGFMITKMKKDLTHKKQFIVVYLYMWAYQLLQGRNHIKKTALNQQDTLFYVTEKDQIILVVSQHWLFLWSRGNVAWGKTLWSNKLCDKHWSLSSFRSVSQCVKTVDTNPLWKKAKTKVLWWCTNQTHHAVLLFQQNVSLV